MLANSLVFLALAYYDENKGPIFWPDLSAGSLRLTPYHSQKAKYTTKYEVPKLK